MNYQKLFDNNEYKPGQTYQTAPIIFVSKKLVDNEDRKERETSVGKSKLLQIPVWGLVIGFSFGIIGMIISITGVVMNNGGSPETAHVLIPLGGVMFIISPFLTLSFKFLGKKDKDKEGETETGNPLI